MEITSFLSPHELKQEFPSPLAHNNCIDKWRKEIAAILRGEDTRLLLILGPCSIHNPESGLEYARRLKSLMDEVSDTFFIVMRAYFEKPRTAFGWKGLLYDPHLNGTHDIVNGIRLSRKFLIDLLKLGLPAATEFLDPLAAPYISDLVSWGCIGARTCQSQIHRQLASSLAMPVGFKNRNDGNIEVAIQGANIAKTAHRFLGIDQSGQVAIIQGQGNICPHIILRGGEEQPNYDLHTIKHAQGLLQKSHLPASLIIDCAHDNSKKNHRFQAQVFSTLIEQIQHGLIKIGGIMLESFLLEANQQSHEAGSRKSPYTHADIAYGASLTDACLDWETTETSIRNAANRLRQNIQENSQERKLDLCITMPL